MEQDPRLILQVPSGILAPALHLHPSTSAFNRPTTMKSGSTDRGVDLSSNGHSAVGPAVEHDSTKALNQSTIERLSASSQHHRRSRKNTEHSKKSDAKQRHKSETDDMPGVSCSPEQNSPGKIQPLHSGPRTKLSFSVDSIISKVTKSKDEELKEGDENSCDRSSSPGSEEGSRPSRDRAGTPASDQHDDGHSNSPRQSSPRRGSRDGSHHRSEFSPPIRPSAIPPGLAGLSYPFSPVGMGLPTWPGLSTAYHSMFPTGAAPTTSTLSKLSSPESKYIDTSTYFSKACGFFNFGILNLPANVVTVH